jgi:hypothetical protein
MSLVGAVTPRLAAHDDDDDDGRRRSNGAGRHPTSVKGAEIDIVELKMVMLPLNLHEQKLQNISE